MNAPHALPASTEKPGGPLEEVPIPASSHETASNDPTAGAPPQRRELPRLRAREVTITELSRSASKVIAGVVDGEVAAVTRHGRPVALVLPLAEAIALLPPDVTMDGELGDLSRRFVARETRRNYSRLAHGRWYYPSGLMPDQRRARDGPRRRWR